MIAQTDVTFKVDMSQQTGFTTPEVNGTFNGWCGSCNAMTDLDGDNIWETTLPLPQGSYEFKFSADAWGSQENLTPGTSCTVSNGGFTNRTLTVGATPVVMDVVCWASCTACALTPTPKTVTFQLDMSQQTGFTTPEVNGTFNGWCGACNSMSDANGDNIWDVTLSINPGTYEFKFSNDAWAGQESLIAGSPCTVTNSGFTNRTLTVTNDTVLPVVCWASCGSCTVTSNVTFSVDMQNYTGAAFTGVFLNGTFNNWCGSCNPMTDANADNIWDVTLPLNNGTIEYKFTLDGWANSEQFVGGESCTITNGGFTNRYDTIAGDVAFPVVCYASCSACSTGSLEEISINATVYPVPASDILTVETTSAIQSYSIIDVMGNELMNNDFQSTISVKELTAGVYFIVLNGAGSKQVIRFIKK
jgi:hypothetical protein